MSWGDDEATARYIAVIHWLGDKHGRPKRGWQAKVAESLKLYPSDLCEVLKGRRRLQQLTAIHHASKVGVPAHYFTSKKRLTVDEAMNQAPVAAPKEEPMGIAREDLEEGGTCWLVSGAFGGAAPRKQRVKVRKIERAAATIVFLDGKQDGRELVVSFKQLEADDDFLQLRTAREQQRTARLKGDSILPPPPPPNAFNPPRIAPKQQPLKLVTPTAPGKSDFDSWLEMGSDVLVALQRDGEAARMEFEALQAEREAIDKQIGTVAKRLADLERKRAALQSLIGEPEPVQMAAAE